MVVVPETLSSLGDSMLKKTLSTMSACLRITIIPALIFLSGAAAAQDAEAGKKVFNQCRACHVVDQPTNRVGPHLVGLFGRQAGAVEGYKYSDALKKSGVTWDEETLGKYLKDPKGFIPGNKMAFADVRKDEDLKDLVAYLKSETSK